MSMPARVKREAMRRGRLAAAFALNALPAPRQRGAWLFGAAVGRAYLDNSAALHQHVARERPDIEAFWVIDRDSPDVLRARESGRVMFADALGTWACALAARVHVVSHGVHDVPTCASRLSRQALKVRLGHGLTALKRTKPRAFHTNASANAIFDLVPVASEFEKANKRAWDIEERALVVTGLPRFDPLLRRERDRPRGGRRRILYMPTWRDWVPQTLGREIDGFAKTIGALLTSPSLTQLLEKHDAALDVSLHRILRAYVTTLRQDVTSPRIVLLDPDRDAQDAIVACDLLLTDYSSVTWDALYIDKPVIFFPFDLDRYEAHRGAYFDLRNDLPGPSAPTFERLLELLDDTLSGDLALDQRARAWQTRAFAFRDDRNCERVLAAIEARLR
jgi:CDP-glycerol glycerophosphotransferase (TagB/SpsB family)